MARGSATEAPTLADVAPLLDRLPLLAGSLNTASRGELRALFDVLQLDVVCQPAESAVDVAVTNSNDLGTADDRQRRAHAESWTVAMIGGSMASGRVSSSKYSSSASRRLARASSTVRPGLVTSTVLRRIARLIRRLELA